MIPVAEPLLGQEEIDNVVEAVKSGWISSKGKFIPEFEQGFARYCGGKYGIATSSGTTALHLALSALGIGEDDEVIIPTLSFIASANSVKYAGAKPIFIDSEPDYWCLNPREIESRVTRRTKAIMPVHLYGHPCNMEPIMEIAKNHGLYVIEDAAEAHGAEYRGTKVGSFGDINCFSFYGNKIITTGEGGMCVTNNKRLAEKMKLLRDHGMNPNKRYWYDFVGYNYRMTNVQAAIGCAQLEKIASLIEKKGEIAKWYREGFANLENDRLIKLSPEMPWAKSTYWMFSILIEADRFGLTRDQIIEFLQSRGIETRPLFYPIHSMPPYKVDESFPVAEELSSKGINLPSGASLHQEEITWITEVISGLKR